MKATLSKCRRALFEPLEPAKGWFGGRGTPAEVLLPPPDFDSTSYPKRWLVGKKCKLTNVDVVGSMRKIAIQEMNRKDREIDGLNEQLEEDARCLEHLQVQLLQERSKWAKVERKNAMLQDQISMNMLKETQTMEEQVAGPINPRRLLLLPEVPEGSVVQPKGQRHHLCVLLRHLLSPLLRAGPAVAAGRHRAPVADLLLGMSLSLPTPRRDLLSLTTSTASSSAPTLTPSAPSANHPMPTSSAMPVTDRPLPLGTSSDDFDSASRHRPPDILLRPPRGLLPFSRPLFSLAPRLASSSQ